MTNPIDHAVAYLKALPDAEARVELARLLAAVSPARPLPIAEVALPIDPPRPR